MWGCEERWMPVPKSKLSKAYALTRQMQGIQAAIQISPNLWNHQENARLVQDGACGPYIIFIRSESKATMTDIGLQFKSSNLLSYKVNVPGRISLSCELFPCDCKCHHTVLLCLTLTDQGYPEEPRPLFFSLLLLHAFPPVFSIFIFISVYLMIPLS